MFSDLRLQGKYVNCMAKKMSEKIDFSSLECYRRVEVKYNSLNTGTEEGFQPSVVEAYSDPRGPRTWTVRHLTM